jgi:hypothetical protein
VSANLLDLMDEKTKCIYTTNHILEIDNKKLISFTKAENNGDKKNLISEDFIVNTEIELLSAYYEC